MYRELVYSLLESRSKIIVRKANIICPADNYYYTGIVNFTMLAALLSETFDKFRNTRPCVTDDVRARNGDCNREVKSLYRQKAAHGRNPRTHESCTRRETEVYTERINFMATFTTLSVVIWCPTGTLGILATLVCVFIMRVVILSMAIIPTLSTSILLCNLCYILL